MTPGLDRWLQRATLSLSNESAELVRAEIQEHYESALEAAVAGGASLNEADRMALASLGGAKIANRQYRRVLLTASEARMLDESHLWPVFRRQWPMKAAALFILLASAVTLFKGSVWQGFGELASGLFIGFAVLAPRLPLYTPSRARVARYLRWIVQIGMQLMFVGFWSPSNMITVWIVILCGIIPGMGLFLWLEWKRASIRRKLPVADWPRHLYL